MNLIIFPRSLCFLSAMISRIPRSASGPSDLTWRAHSSAIALTTEGCNLLRYPILAKVAFVESGAPKPADRAAAAVVVPGWNKNDTNKRSLGVRAAIASPISSVLSIGRLIQHLAHIDEHDGTLSAVETVEQQHDRGGSGSTPPSCREPADVGTQEGDQHVEQNLRRVAHVRRPR